MGNISPLRKGAVSGGKEDRTYRPGSCRPRSETNSAGCISPDLSRNSERQKKKKNNRKKPNKRGEGGSGEFPAYPDVGVRQIQRQDIHACNTELGSRGKGTETTLHLNGRKTKSPEGARSGRKTSPREERSRGQGEPGKLFLARLPSKAGKKQKNGKKTKKTKKSGKNRKQTEQKEKKQVAGNEKAGKERKD